MINKINTNPRFFTEKQKSQKIKETKGICEVCHVCSISEFHHITFLEHGGLTIYENMAGICCFCHKIIHNFYKNDREDFERFKNLGGQAGIGIFAAVNFFIKLSEEDFILFKQNKLFEDTEKLKKAITDSFESIVTFSEENIELRNKHLSKEDQEEVEISIISNTFSPNKKL
jgi:hypothetical protein